MLCSSSVNIKNLNSLVLGHFEKLGSEIRDPIADSAIHFEALFQNQGHGILDDKIVAHGSLRLQILQQIRYSYLGKINAATS